MSPQFPQAFDTVYALPDNQTSNRIIANSSGIFIVGTNSVGNNAKTLIQHLDFGGSLIWKTKLESISKGRGIRETSDGNFLVVGSDTDMNGIDDVSVIKLSSQGQVIWKKRIGGSMVDFATDGIELLDGTFMLIGTTQSFGAGPTSMYVIKADANGNEIWTRTFGGNGADGGSELVQINSNEVMLLGYTSSFGSGDRDIYLQTVSIDGDSLWSTTLGGAGYEESQAITQTSDGGFVMSNHSASTDPTHKLLATKLDLNGQLVWEHEFGNLTDHEGGEAVLADSEGNYVFVGRTNSFGNEEQVYFIKTDADGNVLEQLNFGDGGDQRGNDIIEHNGSYYICGTSTATGDSDLLLIKRPI